MNIWVDPETGKAFQADEDGKVLAYEEEPEPVYMTLREDEGGEIVDQEEFDAMWKEGDTITPDGYV